MKAEDLAGVYPLSPLQQGMLFHALYAPESGVYVEQYTCEMHGPLNLEAFKRAWQFLAERHTALRTSFFWKDMEKPVQLVHRKVELPFEVLDWRNLSAEEQQRRLQEHLKADRKRGFDPAKAPLIRVLVIQTGREKHQLLWTFHHLLIDGWSYLLSLREVYATYEALCAGHELQLKPARPYGDYIGWLQKHNLSEAEQYWRKALKGFSAPTPIGGEAAQTNSAPLHTDTYGEVHASLSAQQTELLRAFARKQQVTLNTVFQGAFSILLSRYSNEIDVVFGATVSGRPAELTGVEAMVGMFINSLPVRVPVLPQEKLGPWLQQIQNNQVQQRRFECTPLSQIQGWSEVPRNLPLFESLLVFENVPAESAPWENGTLKFRDIRFLSRAHYPLCLMVVPRETIAFRLMYDGVRIDESAAQRLVGHLKTLLDAMVKAPEQPLGLLPILTEQEIRQIVSWNATGTNYPRRCIHQLFEEQAAKTPNAIALKFGKHTLTYRELNERANQLAHRLRRMGVGPEVMVGMCLERSLEMIIATLAIVKAGGVYAPLDPGYPPERLTFMIEDTATPVLLTTTRLAGSLPPHRAQTILLDQEAAALAKESKENLLNRNVPENLVYVMYTSGSTGRPKGTCVPHHAVLRLVRNTHYMRFGPDEVFMQFAPVSFDAATLEIWGALLNGAKLTIFPPHLPSLQELGEFLIKEKVTMLWITTGLFHQMVEECFHGLTPMKQILTGGDVLSVPHMKKTAEAMAGKLIACYGPTENTTFTSTHTIDPNNIGTTVSIGKPISNSTMYILDRQMNLAPVGIPGEIFIGGEGLSRGYLNRPELTAEKFVPNPFGKPGERLYRTGDLAKYRPDGNMDFCGRVDNQVKIRGFRVEPAEIEAVLLKHEKVRDAVITVRKDKSGSKSLIAYCAPYPDQTLTSDELRAFLSAKLPPHMLPSVIMVLETLPLNANGKVDRKALPEPDAPRSGSEAQKIEAPASELERKLAKIWEDVLNVRPIGRTDNFFDLGGHSLLATRLFSLIDKQLGKHLPLATLFQAPTVAQLAAVIEGKQESKAPATLLAIQPHGKRRPFFCVQAGDGSVLLFANLANRLGKDQPFYVLQQQGLDAKREYYTKIEELAAEYIKEIKKVQPTGPYQIGGVCFGGKVAFEMAQQLEAAGERVALVALFDSYAPRKQQPKRTLSYRLRGMLHRMWYHVGYISIFGPRYIVERARARARWVAYKAYADSARPLPHDLRYFHAEEVNARIQAQYEPKIYPGRLTVFRSQRQLAEWSFGPHLGWGPLAAAGVDLQTIPGAFGAMFGEPFVVDLADKFQRCLDEIERAEPYGQPARALVAELINS